MYFFKEEHKNFIPEAVKDRIFLADRLIEDIDESLKDKSQKNLRSIKSAIFDIVVLEKVLNKAGITCCLEGDLRDIRNSLAHIDERMEKSSYSPVKIDDLRANYIKKGQKFSNSVSVNFQGAVTSVRIGIPVDDSSVSISVVSLYGMIDDNFLWVDKNGNQRSTKIKNIQKDYEKFKDKLVSK